MSGQRCQHSTNLQILLILRSKSRSFIHVRSVTQHHENQRDTSELKELVVYLLSTL